MRTFIDTPDKPFWYGRRWNIKVTENDHVLYSTIESGIRIQRHEAARWYADWKEELIEKQLLRKRQEPSQWCWTGKDGQWECAYSGIVVQLKLLDGREEKGLWQVCLPTDEATTSKLKYIKPRHLNAAKWFAEQLLLSQTDQPLHRVPWKHALVYENTVSGFAMPEKWIPLAHYLQDSLENALHQSVKVFHEPLIDFNEHVNLAKRLAELQSSRTVAIVQWSTVWEFSYFGILVKNTDLLDQVLHALPAYQLMGSYHLDLPLIPQFKAALLPLGDTEELALQLISDFPRGTIFLTGWVDDETDESQFDAPSYYEIRRMQLSLFPSLTDFAATWKKYPWVFLDGEESLIDELHQMAVNHGFPCDLANQLPYLRNNLHRFRIAVIANNTDCDFEFTVLIDNNGVETWQKYNPIAYW